MDIIPSRATEHAPNNRCAITRSLAVRSNRDMPTYLPYQEHLSPPTDGITAAPGHAADLTDWEVRVLYWVALGKTDPDIGRLMDLSVFTVKHHLKHIFKKLAVVTRTQAVDAYNGFLLND